MRSGRVQTMLGRRHAMDPACGIIPRGGCPSGSLYKHINYQVNDNKFESNHLNTLEGLPESAFESALSHIGYFIVLIEDDLSKRNC